MSFGLEISQGIKIPVAKPHNLNLITDALMVKENLTPATCPLTPTNVQWHVHTHINKQKILSKVIKLLLSAARKNTQFFKLATWRVTTS